MVLIASCAAHDVSPDRPRSTRAAEQAPPAWRIALEPFALSEVAEDVFVSTADVIRIAADAEVAMRSRPGAPDALRVFFAGDFDAFDGVRPSFYEALATPPGTFVAWKGADLGSGWTYSAVVLRAPPLATSADVVEVVIATERVYMCGNDTTGHVEPYGLSMTLSAEAHARINASQRARPRGSIVATAYGHVLHEVRPGEAGPFSMMFRDVQSRRASESLIGAICKRAQTGASASEEGGPARRTTPGRW